MGYLNEFRTQIANRDFQKFIQLWEEYCTCDSAEYEELLSLLNMIKNSDFSKPFGEFTEKILPQWEMLTSKEESYAILKLILELQSTNSQKLAEIAQKALEDRYGKEELFTDKLRLVGLRSKGNFQGALTNFDLLIHGKKGNFVFHASGWGTGEIMEVSPVRELYSIEFENVSGMKQVSFTNAFKSLQPLPSDHFLARRFANPDKLEKEAKENPVEVVKCLLRDLGPKTGSEIKDELCELVIPEAEWQKWWQNTRSKLKKDTEIESPQSTKEAFSLRKAAVSHESQFLSTLEKLKKDREILNHCYSFIRDHVALLKSPLIKEAIEQALESILTRQSQPAIKLECLLCLDTLSPNKREQEILQILKEEHHLQDLIDAIEIASFKKQALVYVKKAQPDWIKQFLKLLPKISLGLVRDYIVKELLQEKQQSQIETIITRLLDHPQEEPEFFFWYFQKAMSGDSELPLAKADKRYAFAEGSLMLLHVIENVQEYKDLTKRIYMMLTNKRYALVRELFNDCPLTFAKEFLLLASKCHSLTHTDMKCLHALAAVVHPSLSKEDSKGKKHDSHTLWTTEAGYHKVQDKLKHIATTEVVENSREVEAARALGDLRENSEYKAAVEKRARLQSQLKSLSEQFSRARIITPDDVFNDEVGVGSIVELEDSSGKTIRYTILGQWEADVEKHILSSESKFAQAMLGLHAEDKFTFKDEEYTIKSIKTIFD